MPTKIKSSLSVKRIASKNKNEPKKIHGMRDILPHDEELWKFLWSSIHTLTDLHDYRFIETPPLELESIVSPVFAGVSDASNPLCSCVLSNGESAALTVVPEIGIMRSYCEGHLGHFASPLKVFHEGPVFRRIQNEKNSIRELYECGFEIIGESSDDIYDGQLILTALDFVKILKIKNVILTVSTLGCKVCRATFREKTRLYYSGRKEKLCDTCARLLEKNGPFERFSCENEICKDIHARSPIILDYMCHSCNNHFKTVLELLEESEVLYEPDPRLSRSFQFYNRTVFELRVGKNVLCIGGRYDYLAEMMFGRSVPGAGVSFSVENLFSEMKTQQTPLFFPKTKSKIFFIAVGEQARKGSLKIINDLRMHTIPVIESLGKKSLVAQLKAAGKANAKIALIFGQRESFEGTVIFRDLTSGAQETFLAKSVVEEIKKRWH